jgi:hypothetical protein
MAGIVEAPHAALCSISIKSASTNSCRRPPVPRAHANRASNSALPLSVAFSDTRLALQLSLIIAALWIAPQVKIHHLLHMTSGVSDYDGEAYAKAQFADRTHDFSPIEIIGNFVSPTLKNPPGTKQG